MEAMIYIHLYFERSKILHPLLFDVSYDTLWILCYNLSKIGLLLRQVLRLEIRVRACIVTVQ